jgi:hypothetical protein
MSDQVMQLHFTTGTLTVRGEHAITLSGTDVFDHGDPYQFTADGITASRALLNGVRIVTDADLDEQGIPCDILTGWQAANACPAAEPPPALVGRHVPFPDSGRLIWCWSDLVPVGSYGKPPDGPQPAEGAEDWELAEDEPGESREANRWA